MSSSSTKSGSGSDSQLIVNVSGSHTLHRVAELCDVSFCVSHEHHDQAEVIKQVTEVANELTKLLRELAPPKLDASSALPPSSKDANSAATEQGAMTVEQADQAAEERDTTKPVAKWSMARMHTYSFVPYISNRKVDDPEPKRKWKATASFDVTWRDFKKLEEFVGEISRNKYIEVGNLSWRITKKTREALQTLVRQAALRNAAKKVADYGSVYSASAPIPFEINDGYTPSSGGGGADGMSYGSAPRAMRMMAGAPGGGGQQDEPTLSFEPEEVAVSASIQARFAVPNKA